VYGLFDLNQHEPVDEDQEEDYLGFGLLYLRESLKVLGIATETDNERFSEMCTLHDKKPSITRKNHLISVKLL
jgi:hypothetical protein